MTQSVCTHQAPSSFKPNQIVTVVDVPFKDEQALAQAELYSHIESQAKAVAPTQDPLTYSDRRIIGEIIEVNPNQFAPSGSKAGLRYGCS